MRHQNILVVDDDRMVAEALSRVLRRRDYQVTTACDPYDAILALRDSCFDAMVVDFAMPGINGLEVFCQAQAQGRALPTVLMSGQIDVPTAVEAMKLGVDDVFEKPVDVERLCAWLGRAGQLSISGASAPHDRKDTCSTPDDTLHSSDACAPDEWRVLRADAGPNPTPGLSGSYLSASDSRSSASGVDPLACGAVHYIGESLDARTVRQQVARVSRFAAMSVLIEGETGTGKELVARAIHEASSPGQPFVSLNCAAIPRDLFESELFGHERGAFSGASQAREGLFSAAGAGTIFLDEIGEMPMEMQPKLLRVLEQREFRRVGSNRNEPMRARVVSATNRALVGEERGALRTDLYFRLAGVTVRTPSLRERAEDIGALTECFARQFATRYNVPVVRFGRDALAALEEHAWPGNVRELRAVVEHVAMGAAGRIATLVDVQQVLKQRDGFRDVEESGVRMAYRPVLPEIERDAIVDAYRDCGSNISRAARELGIPRSTLRDRLRKYGIR